MIKKEIVLRASQEDVWRFITSPDHFQDIWGSRIECVLKAEGEIRLLDTGESVKIQNFIAPKLLSLLGGYGSLPITTTYALSARNDRTVLKITICGWEKLGQTEARQKVPALSLEWEKRLFTIKQIVESKETIEENLSR